MFKMCASFLTALLFAFVMITPVHAADFDGRWVGHWKNSLGERGRDSISLHYSRDGGLKGTWSGNVRVWGKQTGERSIHLRGERDNGTSYDITGYRRHGELHLHYNAMRVNGSTYEGWSELRRD
jgi:hypothetical protein